MLESAYEACLIHELKLNQMQVESQIALPVFYKGVKMVCGYRLDLVVMRRVIVEIKSVADIESIHKAQLLSYLKLFGGDIGLLLNFNVKLLKNGVHRLRL